MPPLIAVDWGTSSLRGVRLNEAGRVLEEKSAPLGILNVPNGDFAGVFASLFSDWMKPAGSVCLISGMAGSRQGWREAPYVACPAGPDELRRRLHWIEPGRIALVPGLAEGLFVLPGTHSKWATVQGGRITGFRTCMTGEFYGLLSRHSILARTLEADAALDEVVFLRGVTHASNGQGLLHNAFGVRAFALFGRLSPAELTSYLSGLLIGEELRRQELPAGREVIAIGAAALTARYTLALGQKGQSVRTFGAEATWAGLRAL